MSLRDVVTTLAEVPTLLQVAREVKSRPLSDCDSLAARVESTTGRFEHHTAVVFEGQTRTWGELNAHANRYAMAIKAQGLVRGDAASLVMENRIEFLAALIALNKLGVTAALINTNLTGRPLTHCIKITQSKLCIFGEERLQAVEEVRSESELSDIANYLFVPDEGTTQCPDWAQDLEQQAENVDDSNPPDTGQATLGDVALNIFTSGTTGLPKAAVISNRRFLMSSALSYKGGLKCKEHDCIYICLPLYHGTGLFLGAGASFAQVPRCFFDVNFPEAVSSGKYATTALPASFTLVSYAATFSTPRSCPMTSKAH